MTTANNTAAGGYSGLRMTANEYLDLGETEERYELIDGVVILSPSPTTRHQRVGLLIALQIERQARLLGGLRVVPDVDVRVSERAVYRPDIVVYRQNRLRTLPNRLTTPPDLVVEVLSPGSKTRDLKTKRDGYDRFGIGEYWVVEPKDVRVRCWTRRGKSLVEVAVQSSNLASTILPGLNIDLEVIRAEIA
jgi:Uma2 family endonuclease